MAEKRGAGSEQKGVGETAAKKSAPRKGARSAGETTPPRTGRASGASTTGETGAAPKEAQPSGATSGKAGAGGSRRAASPAAGGAKAGAKAGGGTGARGAGGGARAGGKAAGGKAAPDLRKDLRDFAGARPDGWSHEDWLKFLEDLQSRGHNINDRDAIGSMLERERLALALERIPGVGPQRVKSIADRYGYLWRLRETDADQLSREANVPKQVAEKVIDGLRR